jgi:hypothetical protein
MEFITFKQTFQASFKEFVSGQSHLYYVDVDKETLWDTYLSSFPENILQEFNCNACRQFIKNYGNLVRINKGDYSVSSFWEFKTGDSVYQRVVDNLASLVETASIHNVFVNSFNKLGTDYNFEGDIKWNHLYYQLPSTVKLCRSADIESKKSEYRDNASVFKRSLEELTSGSVSTVLELIAENNLYRGQEFKGLLEAFQKHLVEYNSIHNKDNYCWYYATQLTTVLRIRNTSIGTLLIDLSKGIDLDVAVRKFEAVVAPTNYKRPTAIVSTKMIQDAQQTIADLGLTTSLQRRFANIDDVNVNNLLWVNRNNSTGDIFADLQKDLVVNPRSLKTESTTLDNFISTVLPVAESIEVLVANNHEPNLVSLLTAADNEAPTLFKWDNSFSWSYNKGLTDSLKDKVKAAGGKVEGKLRVSLEWYNYDDLDLHIQEGNFFHIYYGNKRSPYTQGELDVDKNVSPETRTPVENIIYGYNSNLKDGTYLVKVHNFNHRENVDVGFKVEIEFNGEVYEFTADKSPTYKHYTDVATITVKDGVITVKLNGQQSGSKLVSKNIWGLNTNKFYYVQAVMYSPNYWGNNSVGNKHVILAIPEAKNNETVRGIFNEFLSQELSKHSKVFEVLGSKLVVPYTNNQLSGLGFSSTLHNEFIVRVNHNKLLKVGV